MEKVAIIELNEKEVRLSVFKVNGSRKILVLEQVQPLTIGKEEVLPSPLRKTILGFSKAPSQRSLLRGAEHYGARISMAVQHVKKLSRKVAVARSVLR